MKPPVLKILTPLVFVLLSFLSFTYLFHSKPVILPIVAITQFIEHPALDLEREAIMTTLKRQGYKDGETVKIIYQNAQGSIAVASQIATQLVEYNPKVIIAISTPSAQAVKHEAAKRNIPLVFTAVTDPVSAKLVESLSQQNAHSSVTGVSDFLPSKSLLLMVRKFMPHLKKLGVLYNPGESNSLAIMKDLEQEALTFGIQLRVAPVNKTAEARTAAESLVGNVEAILVPNDNTVISAFESVAPIGLKNHLPIFTAEPNTIGKGAVAAIGYHRPQLGEMAANLAIKILQGEKPSDLPVQHQHTPTLLLDKRVAAKMDIPLPAGTEETTENVVNLGHLPLGA